MRPWWSLPAVRHQHKINSLKNLFEKSTLSIGAAIDDGLSIEFRLNDIDAPETGGVGAAMGGAKCEAERALSYEAKEWAVEFTRGVELQISREYGMDRYNRIIVDLSANGQDVGGAGIEAGVYQSWKHDGKKQLEPRPKWCER